MEIDYSSQSVPTAPYRQIAQDSASAVLFLHGITGSPAAWFPIARSMNRHGISVSVPLLPGHGTRWQDLNATTWSDWLAAAKAELEALSRTHSRVVVAGLSMGGALALALGTGDSPPDELVLINPALYIDSPLTPVLPVLKHVVASVPAIAGDIAHPDRCEYAYDRTPVAAIASFASAQKALRDDLWKIECPVSLFVSGRDSVVGPRTLRTLRSRLTQRPEIISLRRSRHVATLDNDAGIIAEAILEKATSSGRAAAGSPEAGE
ncbi:MAG: alpha/beta fold hydrolase [Brevibacterium sp.]|uniref:alpha/beta hydrolase n=1 Tax=Brevibacterium sp. TaxID=1701 RepID=UPI0026479892|nr:alpha/beta fold hydrolase [Brevibacterium sp.]MDN5807931.1 alpha/beta fold hydrolase [Brevibacterium sp.]MDN5834459.1 alpha/beta fold hydrolase [Brevibacterium sp.]MDN5877275.1 alpha/beta fold hydrolase [Brevibacterium sp.]MDN6122986.1 alpha/beta fold hydrolase [Brevibacterium sp.]MDN6134503.1 alpha/beta fold hydrolase [Brevibacterium sp.]